MPNAPLPNPHTAHEAVAAILSGHSLDGSPFPLKIPFARSKEARDAAVKLLEELLAYQAEVTPQQLTALTAKLLTHLSKTGLQTPDAIATFPTSNLADAIREKPELITAASPR